MTQMRPQDGGSFFDPDFGEDFGDELGEAQLFYEDLMGTGSRTRDAFSEKWLERRRDLEPEETFDSRYARSDVAAPPAGESVPSFDVGAEDNTAREFVELPVHVEDFVPNHAGTGLVMTRFACATPAELRAVFPAAPARIGASPVALWQVGGPKLKAAFELRIVHPATSAGGTTLPQGRHPLAIVCMGNHSAHDGATEILSHRGYPYLQEALAQRGIVSASVNTNAANLLNLKIETRARLILGAIRKMRRFSRTAGSRYRRRIDFSRVALIGHSRGGDAVVRTLRMLQRSRIANVRALVQLAPTDMTGLLRGNEPTGLPAPPAGAPTRRFVTRPLRTGPDVHQLIVWGSRDGDVSGFQDVRTDVAVNPFRHYDRSAAKRAFQFWHGATHNRFNRLWTDDEEDCIGQTGACDPTTGLVRHHITAGLMSRADQEARTIEMVRGWLLFSLYGEVSLAELFDGRTATTVASSLPIVGIWKFGRSLRTIDRFDDLQPGTNTLGGQNISPATGVFGEVTVANENPAGAGITAYQLPHIDRALRFSPAPNVPGIAAPRWRTAIPSGKRDFRRFDLLTFRVTKKYDAAKLRAGTATLPGVRVRLIRSAAASHIETAGGRLSRLPIERRFVPPASIFGTSLVDLTKVHYETWEVELSSYPASVRRDVRFVELEVSTEDGEPVYIDTLSLVKRP